MTPPTANSAPSIILASSSSYRRAQLHKHFGLSPACISPNIDETALPQEPPKAQALRLSQMKADAVARGLQSPGLIIAGDQTAAFEGQLLRKPGDHKTAHSQLTAMAGKTITFYSGVCVMNSQSRQTLLECVETQVRLRSLNSEQIEHYLQTDRPYDCVGAFKQECLGIALFEWVESSDPSALTGLPLIALSIMLHRLGFDVITGSTTHK